MKGRSASLYGNVYEQMIHENLSRVLYLGKRVKCSDIAGSQKGVDLVLEVDNKKVGIECKTRNAFEGGARSFTLSDNKLKMKDEFFNSIIGSYLPFGGRIPQFLLGKKEIREWEEEKENFKGEYICLSDRHIVSNYYNKKNVSYIQIENHGLYHTGNDVLDLKVPHFLCEIKIRIRCKQHTSSSLPSSVQASLIFNRRTLPSSPYDLGDIDKFPEKMKYLPRFKIIYSG